MIPSKTAWKEGDTRSCEDLYCRMVYIVHFCTLFRLKIEGSFFRSVRGGPIPAAAVRARDPRYAAASLSGSDVLP